MECDQDQDNEFVENTILYDPQSSLDDQNHEFVENNILYDPESSLADQDNEFVENNILYDPESSLAVQDNEFVENNILYDPQSSLNDQNHEFVENNILYDPESSLADQDNEFVENNILYDPESSLAVQDNEFVENNILYDPQSSLDDQNHEFVENNILYDPESSLADQDNEFVENNILYDPESSLADQDNEFVENNILYDPLSSLDDQDNEFVENNILYDPESSLADQDNEFVENNILYDPESSLADQDNEFVENNILYDPLSSLDDQDNEFVENNILYDPESSLDDHVQSVDEENVLRCHSIQEPNICFENLEIEVNNCEDLISYDPESNGEDEFNPNSPQVSINEVDVTYEGRPKRGRKRKIPEQSRADRKRLINTNKTHINTKGDIYHEKIFDDQFECFCSRNCTRLVDIGERRRLFTQFWAMGTFQGRCALLMSCVTQNLKKRTYTKNRVRNRMMTRRYTIFGKTVCKKTLLETLEISQSRLNTALRKQLCCDTYTDCRGKVSGGANAFPASKKAEVRVHIASFPKYISHYTRAQTESKYLRADLNLAKIYRLYKDESDNPVSKSFYKRVFYKYFNLRFKKPKKDTCLKCDLYLVKKKTATGADLEMLEEWHHDHIEQAELLTNQMKADLENARNDNELETMTYDMQKTLPVPKLPTSIVYYKRQLNIYNLGIHVGSTGKGIFNLWKEIEASKGTQEVGSCLKKHIDKISKPIKKLILWSDSCGGQNRSIKLVLMMMFILQNHKTLESISIRYLLSGHSFLPNDTEFGDAECALKQHEILCTDVQYMEVMEACRIENKFVVNRMSPDDFFSVNKLEALITNRKKDINNKKISWLETHEILLEKVQPAIIKMTKNIGGIFQSVNLEKLGCKCDFKNIVLDKLWPMGKSLSKEKIKDLNDMMGLVPEKDRHFYEFLKVVTSAEFIDDVDGFGESIDFEAEI